MRRIEEYEKRVLDVFEAGKLEPVTLVWKMQLRVAEMSVQCRISLDPNSTFYRYSFDMESRPEIYQRMLELEDMEFSDQILLELKDKLQKECSDKYEIKVIEESSLWLSIEVRV